MQVILNSDVEKLGKIGEVVNVKDGYARNFLIPRGLASLASRGSLKQVARKQELQAKELEKKKKTAQELAQKLKGFSVTISVEANEEDKLFGSLTSVEIAKVCKIDNFVFDKKNVVLDEPIHKLGVYKAKVNLHPEVSQEIKIWVVRK